MGDKNDLLDERCESVVRSQSVVRSPSVARSKGPVPVRALSSGGPERLPYKQEVAGSSPAAPTPSTPAAPVPGSPGEEQATARRRRRGVGGAVAAVWWLAACGGGADDPSPVSVAPPDPPDPQQPNQLPTASFTLSVADGRAPLAVNFDARRSSDPDGSIASYAWTFGDGGTGSGAQVAHTFDADGRHEVRLVVQDDRGAQDSAAATVFVSSAPGDGPNAIEGVVWFDQDGDSVRGPAEPGLERFAVFLDDDEDGERDEGEPVAFSNAGGAYSFPGLAADRSYLVTQSLPFGWTNTAAGPPASAQAVASTPPVAGIVNGEDAAIEVFPFQVALRFKESGFQFCGGTFLNSRYVLTAAHCVDGDVVARDVEVLAGTGDKTSGGERLEVSAIRIHPDYSATLDGDVAILRLTRTVLYPRVYLQEPGQPSYSTPGDTATAIGWGQTEQGQGSNVLKRIPLPIITNDDCAKIAGAFFEGIGARTICAGAERLNRGVCFGDSGGPLLVPYRDSWMEIGVASFLVNRDQCGNIPGAFARVSALYDYIVAVARIEDSQAHAVEWSGDATRVRVDFGNFH